MSSFFSTIFFLFILFFYCTAQDTRGALVSLNPDNLDKTEVPSETTTGNNPIPADPTLAPSVASEDINGSTSNATDASMEEGLSEDEDTTKDPSEVPMEDTSEDTTAIPFLRKDDVAKEEEVSTLMRLDDGISSTSYVGIGIGCAGLAGVIASILWLQKRHSTERVSFSSNISSFSPHDPRPPLTSPSRLSWPVASGGSGCEINAFQRHESPTTNRHTQHYTAPLGPSPTAPWTNPAHRNSEQMTNQRRAVTQRSPSALRLSFEQRQRSIRASFSPEEEHGRYSSPIVRRPLPTLRATVVHPKMVSNFTSKSYENMSAHSSYQSNSEDELYPQRHPRPEMPAQSNTRKKVSSDQEESIWWSAVHDMECTDSSSGVEGEGISILSDSDDEVSLSPIHKPHHEMRTHHEMQPGTSCTL